MLGFSSSMEALGDKNLGRRAVRTRWAGRRERARGTGDKKAKTSRRTQILIWQKAQPFRVKRSQSDNMDEHHLASTPRYYFRFVDTIGFGSCDACYRIGPVNHVCLHCCISEGMTLGSCFVCHHEGPVWEECQWCERGRCLAPGYGQCRECEWHGTVGDECRNCEDGIFTPLSVSGSDSSNVLLDIIVLAEMQEASSSDTDSDQPVASRTRSLDRT